MKLRYTTLLAFALIGTGELAHSEHLYQADGKEVNLTLCDSLLVIQLNQTAQVRDSSLIALERPELLDDFTPRSLAYGFYIYGLTPGADVATLVTTLRQSPSVAVVNPVFLGSHDEPMFARDLIILEFLPEVTYAEIDSINQVLAEYVNPPDSDAPRRYFVRMKHDLHLSAVDVANLYYESGLCRFAQPDFLFRPGLLDEAAPDSIIGGEKYYPFQWHWRNTGQSGGVVDADIDADSAWMVTMGDSTVRVAVLDDGFDVYHEDRVMDCQYCPIRSYDAVGDWAAYPQPDLDVVDWHCDTVREPCGHGTSVLGIIAAANENDLGLRGLAPRSKFYAIKCFDEYGMSSDSLLAASLHHAWSYCQCKIVSCSWYSPWHGDLLPAELDSMRAHGVFVVFGAGNSGFVEYPQYSPSVTTVGAVNDSDVAWSWSGKGPSLDFVAPTGNKGRGPSNRGYTWTWDMMGSAGYVPEIVPAWQCDSTLNYMCKFGGTSAAAPQVAGIAALLLARTDFADSADPAGLIRYVLDSSSQDKGPTGYDTTYGNGRVNAYRALLSVIRGDVNNDGIITVLDVNLEVDIVFRAGHAVLDDRTADVNCDGLRNITDIMFLVNKVYKGGPVPGICFRY